VITSDIKEGIKSGMYWILLGIPFIIVIGSMMHFVYDWSGNLTIVGIFAPVNESIWEHLKMTFWPTLFWWLLGYLLLHKTSRIATCQWFFACSISLIVCPLVIVSFYYSYTGAFGIHSLILDIFSMILGVIIAQFLALHIYRYINSSFLYCMIAFATIFILMIAFIYFTFSPPQIPLFLDSSTGSYGM
jgi:hypothetical protein